ncbi:hypothetical protein [Paenibacillus silvisoli]|uniref:hypothetical protein n=1 Tax=Paenibacillus silvisoli TaxID=3110539 RepID=UPI00280492A6|nr:hypothetical protein [Paenibacillus silvisoli]
MTYARLIVVVLAIEVFITVVTGIGIYYGFSVFPFMQSTIGSADPGVTTSGINATIPLYMPSLADLKAPYTYLKNNAESGLGVASIISYAAIVVVQSFARGMYLGGIKGWVVQRGSVSLFACGRRYFRSMLAWSIFQNALGLFIVFLAAAFFPLGIILMIALLFYSLAPYLIVIQEIPLDEALAKAPRLFRKYFRSLLPLALLAMLCTVIISLFRSLSPPMGYAVPLVAYACVGTLLIAELMKKLTMNLAEDREKTPVLPIGEIPRRRWADYGILLLIPVITAVGMYAYTGKHLVLLDMSSKTRLSGIAYNSNFSDVFYSSEQRYTAYEWQTNDYRLSIHLPDLSGGRQPDELRGVAEISWLVNEEKRIVNGRSTSIYVEPVMRTNRLLYRLVRTTSDNGSSYYSSVNGSITILPGGGRPNDPLAAQMMISGDGSELFVMQYPSRFDSSQAVRVTADGKYLVAGTSPVNPADFRTYWFSKEQRTDRVLELLTAKNRFNFIASLNRAYVALACALQEGDGRMVVELLDHMRQGNVKVQAPDWDEQTWTDYLRSKYKDIDFGQALSYLTKAGMQGAYVGQEQAEQSDAKAGLYRLEVPFPRDTLPIVYKESKEDGRLLSVQVLPK